MSLESPENRDEFIQRCKAGLSALSINITPDQERIAVEKARRIFIENHYESTDTFMVAQKIKQEDIDSGGVFKVPDNVVEVTSLLSYRRALTSTQSSLSGLSLGYEYYSHTAGNGVYTQSNPFSTSVSPTISYWLSRTDSENFQKHFNRADKFRFNKTSRKLSVYGNPHFKVDDFIMYTAEISLEHEPLFWSNEWFIEFASAQMQLMWGNNLTKFKNVELPDGITLNGEEIKSEAKQDLERLMDDLRSTFSYLPQIIIV